MTSQTPISPPFFIVGPSPFYERVLSVLNPIPKYFRLKKVRAVFIDACRNNNLEKIERLLPRVEGLNWVMKFPKYGGKITKDTIYCKNYPLEVAIQERNLEMVELFLKNGADPHFKGTLLHPVVPPLFRAIRLTHPAKLRAMGFSPEDFKDLNFKKIDFQIFESLLNYGKNDKINDLWTINNLKRFKEDNHNIKMEEYEGRNIFHLAVLKEAPTSFIELLLKHKANPLCESTNLDTPLSLAKGETKQILEFYIQKMGLEKSLPNPKPAPSHQSRL